MPPGNPVPTAYNSAHKLRAHTRRAFIHGSVYRRALRAHPRIPDAIVRIRAAALDEIY
jgi:hypothetical protein